MIYKIKLIRKRTSGLIKICNERIHPLQRFHSCLDLRANFFGPPIILSGSDFLSLSLSEAWARPGEAQARPREALARPWEAKSRPWEVQARPWEARARAWKALVRPREASARP